MERNPELERFFEYLQSVIGELVSSSLTPLRVDKIREVVGVDAAYSGEFMITEAVSWNLEQNKVTEEEIHVSRPPYPYVPGLLFLREAPAMLEAIRKLRREWDLLLVDAHGLLHPRKAGLAVFLGLIVRRPCIGVGKTLLVGEPTGSGEMGEIYFEGRRLGYWFSPRGSRRFYVSPGYGIRVEEIPGIIRRLGSRYPEVLRIADRVAKRELKRLTGD